VLYNHAMCLSRVLIETCNDVVGDGGGNDTKHEDNDKDTRII